MRLDNSKMAILVNKNFETMSKMTYLFSKCVCMSQNTGILETAKNGVCQHTLI